MLLAEPPQSGNPIISQVVLAAIAYGDSLTGKRAQEAARLLQDLEAFAAWAEDLL